MFFIGKVTEEWRALQCVFYRMLTIKVCFCFVEMYFLLIHFSVTFDCLYSIYAEVALMNEIDNLPEELALRPVTVWRKNNLFLGSVNGI